LRAGEDAVREMGFNRLEMGAWTGVPFYGRMGYKEVKGRRQEADVGNEVAIGLVKIEKVLASG
jgi:hypothetical protein